MEETRKALAAIKQREEKGESRLQQLQASLTATCQQSEAWREKVSDKEKDLAVCEAERAALEAEVGPHL